ncbi:hypothetical protein AAG570_009829 [Ranatra chinensis]|uniref:Uncharacterized protein n=1 Tax=Ranatra chinensis TaxID=642074 RepID=A0ABD0YQC9_9HEMI
MTDYGYGFDYLSLWKKQYVEPTKYFIPDEEDFKKNSFVFKSFRHEYEVDNAFSHKGLKLLKKMKTNDGVVQMPTKVNHLQNVPGYSPLSNIQRKSLLTQDEMNECFNLILSMKKGPLTPQQMERHNLFREKILQEQNDYLTFVRNYWIKDNYKRHAEITPEVVDLVNKMWRV